MAAHKKKKIIGVYKLTSPIGKIYIGSSAHIKRRFNQYLTLAACVKKQPKLYASLQKHGASSHTFEILLECEQHELFERELEYGQQFNVLGEQGLNLALPKIGDYLNTISEETRKKISEGGKGNKNALGYKHTLESKLKMRTPKSEGHKAWCRKARLGKSQPQSAIIKTSEANKKAVIDTATGYEYSSVQAAANSFALSESTLSRYLSGTRKNKTTLKYKEDVCRA